MIYINSFASMSSLGNTKATIKQALQNKNLINIQKRSDLLLNNKEAYFAYCDHDLNCIDNKYIQHKSYNNTKLIYLCQQLQDCLAYFLDKYAKDRIGIVLGTSTSGQDEADFKFTGYGVHSNYSPYSYYQQEIGDLSRFLAKYLGVSGPCYTISTACSSSTRALISASALLEANLCDVVIAGGADSLSRVTINGFDAMNLISQEICTPFAKNRTGITIGEGAGLMILSKEKAPLFIASGASTSDAYHSSSPLPSGQMAYMAMKMALDKAKIKSCDLGYINLHGTGTKVNDLVEAKIMSEHFSSVKASSSKHLTGHTLAASGIIEACICSMIMLEDLDLITQDFSQKPYDDSLESFNLICKPCKLDKNFIMSNAFAFGGNNACIIIGRQ